MPEADATPKFTVFTPTYNRARTLHRAWESMRAQTFREFEWLVIDDGSTDNTKELVEGWAKEAPFPVRYIWQTNQHKKVAFNRAVKEARGELIIALDSDDTCVPEALERLWWHWTQIPAPEREGFAAVTALCMDQHGQRIGDLFPGGDWIDSTGTEIQHRWKVRGEKWGFQRTSVMKALPFPEDLPGLVPEGYVWSQVDQRYRTRFVNEMLRVYYRDQDDSLITGQTRDPAKDANGAVLCEANELSVGIRWFWHDSFALARKAANLVRITLHCTLPRARLEPLWAKQPLGARLLLLLTSPVGVGVWMADCWRHRAHR